MFLRRFVSQITDDHSNVSIHTPVLQLGDATRRACVYGLLHSCCDIVGASQDSVQTAVHLFERS